MVAFGNAILSARREGWEAAYVDYQGLKELIFLNDPHDFLHKLQREIEKVSLFALHRQGEIAKTLGALRQPQTLRPLLHMTSSSTTPPTQAPHFSTTTTTTPNTTAVIRAVTHCAVELLHWQRFVCINAVGIRKIIKKFQKHHVNWRTYTTTNNDNVNWTADPGDSSLTSGDTVTAETIATTTPRITANDPHLQQLANSAAVAAMNASLWQACLELQPPSPEQPKQPQQQKRTSSYQREKDDDDDDNDDDDDDEDDLITMRQEWIRLQCTVALIQAMRNYAQSMNESFLAFLSNKSMIYGGQPLLSNPDESSLQALRVFLHFEPDTILTMDASRLGNVWEPETTRFLESSFRVINKADKDWGGVDSISLALNLLSTLLYTINYYIVAPTANHYAIKLGVDGAYGASLVGASSLMAIFAAFLYSWWYTRYSFQSALLFSAICPFAGNLMYSLAISYRSMSLAMFGRLMVGLGSAEVVNRQLISTCVSFDSITSASAYFVAAGASGMSIGPLMAALLDMSTGYDVDVDLRLPFMPAGGIIFDHVTSPGFVMAGIWLMQALALVAFFREPTRIHSGIETEDDTSLAGETSLNVHTSLDERVKATLESVGVSLDSQETLPLISTANAGKQRADSALWNVLTDIKTTGNIIFGNMALPVTLYLFSLIELMDEILISSCSMVSRRYFGWPGSTAGFIVASLGALVIPAHFVVEKAAHHFEERFILKYSLVFLVLCLFGILNYEGLIFDFIGTAVAAFTTPSSGVLATRNNTDIKVSGLDLVEVLNEADEVPYDWGAGRSVYLIFLSAIFLGTIVLEGVDTSLMAKVTPPALNASFVNCGLLATLIGTVGRVVGDSLITLSAIVDKDIFTDFVNATFAPMILLVAFGLLFARRFYHLLV